MKMFSDVDQIINVGDCVIYYMDAILRIGVIEEIHKKYVVVNCCDIVDLVRNNLLLEKTDVYKKIHSYLKYEGKEDIYLSVGDEYDGIIKKFEKI